MAQVSGSTNAEETVQGETGFSLKRLKNTMGIAQQKETIRKHHEQTKALTNELMGYAQTHHGKSKQEMIERHAIGKFPANASPSTATPTNTPRLIHPSPNALIPPIVASLP